MFTGKIRPPEVWEFMLTAVIFFLAQIGHDDYLRIWLNKKAEKAET